MIRPYLFACAAMFAFGCQPADAAPAARPRVVLAVDGVEQPRNLPAIVAERLGYFKDAGLTVTLVDAPADPSAATLMADGRADGAVAYYHHTFMSQSDGKAVTRVLVTLGITPGERLMVAARLKDKVHSVADLKGMKIITGGRNSGKTTATTWAFIHAGLNGRDYVSMPLLPSEKAAKALADGSADAIMAHDPDASYLEASGAAYQLLDLATPGGTRAALGTVYPSTALYMPATYIAGHPDEARKLVAALLRSLSFIESHDAQAIVAILPAKAGGRDRAAFVRQVAFDKQMFGGNGATDASAAAAELQAMTALNPLYAKVNLGETFSNAFLPSR